MGLFIGASILTILELFDYIYEVSALPLPHSWQGLGLKALMPTGDIKDHNPPCPTCSTNAIINYK